MIIDALNEFASAKSLVAGTGTTLVGDVMDLGPVPSYWAHGKQLYVVVTFPTEVDSSGDGATVTVTVASDAAAAIATDGSATVLGVTNALTETQMATEGPFVIALNHGLAERYVGILATIAGEAVTAGTISAHVTTDPPAWRTYPEGTS